ncbi:hypothetical protein BJV78DRAFT_1353411 [Lactifluus subvellereus]|nr:hypothetical protein BJV78DRAFT_1353411 [Lactifluus subvellereus]
MYQSRLEHKGNLTCVYRLLTLGDRIILRQIRSLETVVRDSGSTGIVAGLPDTTNFDGRSTPQDGDGNGDTLSGLCPHTLPESHQPVPIAVVNRSPTGRPGHYHVTLYLDLGFNDQGGMIPFQGGTNEEVVHKMYTTLNSEGKDQTEPLSAATRKPNCHVKLMAVDGQIAILGNGNHGQSLLTTDEKWSFRWYGMTVMAPDALNYGDGFIKRAVNRDKWKKISLEKITIT